ncbi:hypothetical protein HDV05_001083 [Chytridiales sp. JEL 0842]|nr:hypothetical protein HDV05_001083 [Chytridiales sp. JEL 0842]
MNTNAIDASPYDNNAKLSASTELPLIPLSSLTITHIQLQHSLAQARQRYHQYQATASTDDAASSTPSGLVKTRKLWEDVRILEGKVKDYERAMQQASTLLLEVVLPPSPTPSHPSAVSHQDPPAATTTTATVQLGPTTPKPTAPVLPVPWNYWTPEGVALQIAKVDVKWFKSFHPRHDLLVFKNPNIKDPVILDNVPYKDAALGDPGRSGLQWGRYLERMVVGAVLVSKGVHHILKGSPAAAAAMGMGTHHAAGVGTLLGGPFVYGTTASTVITPLSTALSGRVATLQAIIATAHILFYGFRDLHGAAHLLKGLAHPSVTRLYESWDLLPQKCWDTLKNLQNLLGIAPVSYTPPQRLDDDGLQLNEDASRILSEDEQLEEIIRDAVGSNLGEGLSSLESSYMPIRTSKEHVSLLLEMLEHHSDQRVMSIIPWLEPIAQEVYELKKDYTVATTADSQPISSTAPVLPWNVVLSETGQKSIEEIIQTIERCQGTRNKKKSPAPPPAPAPAPPVVATEEPNLLPDLPSVPLGPVSAAPPTLQSVISWKGGSGLGIADGSGSFGSGMATLVDPKSNPAAFGASMLLNPPWDRPLAFHVGDLESVGPGDARVEHWLLTRVFVSFEELWRWSFACEPKRREEVGVRDVLEVLEGVRGKQKELMGLKRAKEERVRKQVELEARLKEEEEMKRALESMDSTREDVEVSTDEGNVKGGVVDAARLLSNKSSSVGGDAEEDGDEDLWDKTDGENEDEEEDDDLTIRKDMMQALLVAGSGNAPPISGIPTPNDTADDSIDEPSEAMSTDELARFREYRDVSANEDDEDTFNSTADDESEFQARMKALEALLPTVPGFKEIMSNPPTSESNTDQSQTANIVEPPVVLPTQAETAAVDAQSHGAVEFPDVSSLANIGSNDSLRGSKTASNVMDEFLTPTEGTPHVDRSSSLTDTNEHAEAQEAASAEGGDDMMDMLARRLAKLKPGAK